MPSALEHDDRDVGRLAALRLRDRAHILGRARVYVDRIDGVCAARDLVHVDRGAGKEHRPSLGERDHCDRIRLAERGQTRALEGIDGDVDLRPVAAADVLAVEEHRRFVFLALADDDDSVHRNGVEHQAHRVDRRLVGALLLAAADPPGRTERRRLGHPHQLEREVAIRCRAFHGAGPYIRSGASTPTRSRQRAITCCVARQSASRNASVSDSTTRCSW